MQVVSIIIPNYNNSIWLSKCINSCLLQKGNFEIEVVVVDDFSEDNSWEVLMKYQSNYPKHIKVFRNINKGGNNARNYGFSQSSGEYIQWLDSDDILLPNKINLQLTHLKENTEVDVVYSDWQMDFYKDHKFQKTEYIVKKVYTDFLEQILLNNWNPPHAYLLKKEIVEKTIKNEGWNLKTKVGQDREFYTKAAILGAKFDYCKGNLIIYNRWSSNTVSHVSHKYNIIQTTILNQLFYKLLSTQKRLNSNQLKRYSNLLSTELVQSLFYHRKLKLPRKISFKMVNWSTIHWKIRPIVFLLFLSKLNK